MKLKWYQWLNAVWVIICSGISILGFCTDRYSLGILGLFSAIINLYAFLFAVSRWWEISPKVYNKFVFTCPHCKCQFIPSFWTWFFVPHFGSRRYMRCEKCKQIHWMRRK